MCVWRRGKREGTAMCGGGLQAYGERTAEWVLGTCRTSVGAVYVCVRMLGHTLLYIINAQLGVTLP